jgi:hypothetical protein
MGMIDALLSGAVCLPRDCESFDATAGYDMSPSEDELRPKTLNLVTNFGATYVQFIGTETT